MILEASMRTTLAINEKLLDEVKSLSGAKTKKEAVEKALEEYIRRRKAKKLIELEGKMELSLTLDELIEQRRKDVPHR
jgi:Arc/MetJ family transcription regulator